MGQKFQEVGDKIKQNSPGPNHYSPQLNKSQGKTFGAKLGSSLTGSIGMNVPGPGNYNIDSMAFGSKYKFHMGQKLTD